MGTTHLNQAGEHPGVRSVKKQNVYERTEVTTRNVALAVVAIALVLLVVFLAASGTKVLDITALQGKGDVAERHEPATPGK